MDVVAYERGFAGLVSAGQALVQVTGGFRFVEGPVWVPATAAAGVESDSLIFSDIIGNTVYRWRADAGTEIFRHPSQMANGNTLDREGRLLTCEHATSRVTRTESDGTVATLASRYQGGELNSPNDIVVRADSTIYFTDPTSGRSPTYGVPREPELAFSGVYRLDPESGELTLLVDDFSKPNGLCFSPDQTRLFIDDSDRNHIRVFDVDEAGSLHGGAVWAEMPATGLGVADGMKVDREGNLYCCGRGGIHLFDANGTPLGMIPMPEHTTNLAWGDEDLCSLYVTASTSVYRVRTRVPGPGNAFLREAIAEEIPRSRSGVTGGSND